jgi:hypothetical protein
MWLLAKGILLDLVSAFSLFGKSPGDIHDTQMKDTD